MIARSQEHSAGVHRELADVKSGLTDLKAQLDVPVLRVDSDGTSQGHQNGKVETINLPNFNYCFSSEVCQRVMASLVFNIVSTRCAGCFHENNMTRSSEGSVEECSTHCIPRNCAALINAFLFGKKANMAKQVLQSGTGLEYSKVRKLLAMSLLRNVQWNRFNQFNVPNKKQPASVTSDGEFSPSPTEKYSSSQDNTAGLGGVRIPRPDWLSEDVISGVHIEMTRVRLETKKQDKLKNLQGRRKGEHDNSPSNEDVALTCADKLYKKATFLLHQGRERARNLFFECLGYALTEWELSSVPMMTRRPVLSWRDPIAPLQTVRLEQVPLNKPGVDGKRASTFRKFLKTCTPFVLCIEHDVDIVRDRSASESVGSDESSLKQTRTLRRVVNLVDVGLRVLHAYCGRSLEASTEEMLGSQECTIRAAYSFATVFRGFVQAFMNSTEFDCRNESDLTGLQCHSLSLSEFYPTPSIRSRTMEIMVTCMSESDFATYHVPLQPVEHTVSAHRTSLEGGAAGLAGGVNVMEDEEFVLC